MRGPEHHDALAHVSCKRSACRLRRRISRPFFHALFDRVEQIDQMGTEGCASASRWKLEAGIVPERGDLGRGSA
jgi:hypothetical protein